MWWLCRGCGGHCCGTDGVKGNNSFAQAFFVPQLSAEARARDEETAADARREIAQERREQRIRVGDAVTEAGDPLYVIHPGETAPRENVENLRLPLPPPPPIVEGICRKCRDPAQGAHRCDRCGSQVHPFCGEGIGEECHGQPV